MVGLPYPNIYSPELKEKMTYLDATLGVRFVLCFGIKSFCISTFLIKEHRREVVLCNGGASRKMEDSVNLIMAPGNAIKSTERA